MKTGLYLVIRYGQIDEADAVEEIDKIVTKRGSAWFGKYGQPLSRRLLETFATGEAEAFVVLIRKGMKGEPAGYFYRPYRLAAISRTPPSVRAEYPSYYNQHLRRIGCWLKLERYRGLKFELRDLTIRSSVQPLPLSLGSSMRGHFLCRLGK